MDETELRREFDKHADLTAIAAGAQDKGERRMSKGGLVGFMRQHALAHGDAEVERIMERVDANKDGEIDFGEFRALARANWDLEKVLGSKRLERVFASVFPVGTTPQHLGAMDSKQLSSIFDLSKPAMVKLLVDLAAQVVAVGTAQDAAGGSKFTGELRGGSLEDFYQGVTGVCGPPDADIEKGMREEHTARPDSKEEFTTPNYGITTTPHTEWKLMFEGGSGSVKVQGKEDSVSVTSTRGCCKNGKPQADLRVLRPIAHYGDFGEDGRLKDTCLRDSDTPIQRRVKEGRLRRCDVFALILYTGPMYVLLNAILRGFGFCGAVAAGIEFASDEFWVQWKAVDINAWLKRSGHKFTNTIHALASAIKKLQGLAAHEPSTRLYRGLDGLDLAAFAASSGFTDKAFMSMTKDMGIAQQYSGVHKGLVGTVLCIETSTTNNGAVIVKFSQYPGEEEEVWNACSFLQHLPGRVDVVLLPGGGVVRMYHVLVSANSRAETIEELEAHRKRVVVQVLDTLHADVCRAVDAAFETAEFEQRVAKDKRPEGKGLFIASIKDESKERVEVYKTLPDGAYAAIELLAEAVSKGLALPRLAEAKLRLWLEDPSLNLEEMGNKAWSTYLGLNGAQGRRLARRRLLLLQDGSGGKATAALALEVRHTHALPPRRCLRRWRAVVISGAFMKFLLHNHSINKKKIFFRRCKLRSKFCLFFLLHKRAKHILLPCVHFSSSL